MSTRYVDADSTAGGDGTTNALTGANRAYVSLSAWEAAVQGTFTEIQECICESNGGSHTADGACNIDGSTTTASYYHDIKTSAAGRHAGVFDATKYRLQASYGPSGLLQTNDDYIRVTGLQVYNTFSTAGDNNPGIIESTGQYCAFDKLLARNTIISGQSYTRGIRLGPYNTIRNSIVYDVWNATQSRGNGFDRQNAAVQVKVYNCTAHTCYRGFVTQDEGLSAADQMVVKNCLAAACGDGFLASWQWGTGSNYNASTLASDAPGANSRNSQTFTFVNEAGDNFLLAAGDAGAKDYGVTDPGSGLFSDDILGTTRSGSWDIGAHEYIAAGGATFNPAWARGSNQIIGAWQ